MLSASRALYPPPQKKKVSALNYLGVNILGEPRPDGGVNLLRLLRRGSFPGPDGPDRLIGDHDPAPVGHLVRDGLELPEADLGGFTGLPLLQQLPDAGDDVESGLEGEADLFSDDLVTLAEDVPPLRVSEDHPVAPAVLYHGRANLAFNEGY